jgi:hypothetical protein
MKRIIAVILILACFKAKAQVIDSTKRLVPVDSLNEKSTPLKNKSVIDSVLKNHSPRKATIRSAILPGLGQIYNKKYWKLPIIYGALGTTAAVFIFNYKTYKDLQFAYKAKIEAQPIGPPPYLRPDSTDYKKIKEELLPLEPNALRSFRNQYRKRIDYTVLVFIIFWGLNVADAAVDAHLKSFDISQLA